MTGCQSTGNAVGWDLNPSWGQIVSLNYPSRDVGVFVQQMSVNLSLSLCSIKCERSPPSADVEEKVCFVINKIMFPIQIGPYLLRMCKNTLITTKSRFLLMLLHYEMGGNVISLIMFLLSKDVPTDGIPTETEHLLKL